MTLVSASSQTERLKPEFRNLSWITTEKSAEIVTTLSHHFGDSAIMNNPNLVSEEEYNLYYDSLSIWWLTNEKGAFIDQDTTAKATCYGNFGTVDNNNTEEQWLKVYEENTQIAYKNNNGNTTKGTMYCIPSTYENLNLFYKEESENIKSYNSGRIKVYQISTTLIDKDVVNFYLAFHKTIKPIETRGVVAYGRPIVPYFYRYPYPKNKVEKPTIEDIWEKETGLPRSLIGELNIVQDKIEEILGLMGTVNNDVLISDPDVELIHMPIKPIETQDPIIVDEIITVSCDTCDVVIYDDQQQDGDIVEFIYNNTSETVHILNAGSTHQVILDDSGVFKLVALSEGRLKPCTIFLRIDGQSYTFRLKKDEQIVIKLYKP